MFCFKLSSFKDFISHFRRTDFLAAGGAAVAATLGGWTPSILFTAAYLGYRVHYGNRLNEKREIILLNQKYSFNDGMGDIVFAEKTQKILQKHFPSIPVTIVPQDELTQKALQAQKIPYKSLSDLSLKNRCLIIQGPVIEEDPPKDLEGLDTWRIGEYSFGTSNQPNSFRTGLGEGEWGIFVPPNLNKEPIPHPITDLQNGHLQKHFNPNNSSYLGYTNCVYSPRNFILPILFKEKDNPENIDFIFPSDRLLHKEILPRLFDTLTECKGQFASAGVDTCEIISPSYDPIEVYRNTSTDSSKGKTVRIILPGGVSREDLKILSSCTKKIRLATGDQSFSEALGNLLFYETKSHKKGFAKNVKDLADKLKLKKVSTFIESSFFPADDRGIVNAKKLGELLNNEELEDEFSTLAEYINKNCNFETILVKNIQAWLSGKFDPTNPQTVS